MAGGGLLTEIGQHESNDLVVGGTCPYGVVSFKGWKDAPRSSTAKRFDLVDGQSTGIVTRPPRTIVLQLKLNGVTTWEAAEAAEDELRAAWGGVAETQLYRLCPDGLIRWVTGYWMELDFPGVQLPQAGNSLATATFVADDPTVQVLT